ncbi:hypothetical protein Nepgr_008818 [Nepenthes gracilis]|uniref:Serine aminopeptidase S33 domain-containing protein n=1 Tax=Nepenthes gracilis TaxID=150966 RepID=A0AAD3S9C6_NEPGR|nr:hypothetical protein Nepgr_008818 [Nepenthes gracilis]
MEAVQVEELTSGASGRIIPVFKNIRGSMPSSESVKEALILFYSTFICFLLLLLPRSSRISCSSTPSPSSSSSMSPSSPKSSVRRRLGSTRFGIWRDEEDTMRRRALAEAVEMVPEGGDVGLSVCKWNKSLFFGVRMNALFCRSWFPATGDLKGILIVIHGLNEHSGRYAYFAKQLTSCSFGVYAMDWIGHGGSDGLHGYVPSLDHVVADTGAFLEKVKLDNPGVPCFLFGHSTGGAVVLKVASHPHIERKLEGIILTSPALRVKPAHPVVRVVAPIFSVVAPRLQFKGANKRGIPVSRDPAQLHAKYSDPLVYTGPIRVRTGHEILRISSYLMRSFKSITVPFFVLHGTGDRVTDPLASQELFNEASSRFKDIKLYDGFFHDLLFEPEREEVARDIINWMEKMLHA